MNSKKLTGRSDGSKQGIHLIWRVFETEYRRLIDGTKSMLTARWSTLVN